MRHQTIALFLIGLAMASCSADPKSAVGASLSGGVRFQHRVHERNDGKTMLIVTPVRGVGRDPTRSVCQPDLPEGLQLLWPRSARRLEG